MAIIIETKVPERSTRIIPVSFFDETGAAVVPSSVTWSLATYPAGAAVNGRTDVSITPASTVNIALTDADLSILSPADDGRRVVTIKAAYTSGTYGSMKLKDEIRFSVEKLVGVS